MHDLIDSKHLDELAAQSGCKSRIGRLSFTPDSILEMLHERLLQRNVVKLVEFGCGHGMLPRWLAQQGSTIDYLGV
ncbi:MAG: hypothetical protein M3M96_00875, partial [Candidatus Eremiobacteraeota bacterium]|nr:hypothetical protein [Candidatus Eremiobacteraeota bacterium]